MYIQKPIIPQNPMHQPLQICHIPIQLTPTCKQILYSKSTQNPYDRDIIPGQYEGGYKVWQCTIDMLKFMATAHFNFKQAAVMDIGCGHGLLGIAAGKLGAGSCCFQDFNKQVLMTATKNNIIINDIPIKNCTFIDGDWDNIQQPNNKIDIILGAQLIYRAQNYIKVINLCKRVLRPGTGRAILANKHHYFGLDGNMDDFKQKIQQNGLKYESLLKIVPPKGGNKKEIIAIWIDTEMKQ